MKKIIGIFIISCLLSLPAISQSLARMPDSIRNKRANENKPVPPAKVVAEVAVSVPLTEDLIKDTLVKLALKNPAFTVADANIRISEMDRKKANSAWLSNISAGANINEFVIQGSAAASFFPKYNLGISVPFDIIQRNKHARSTADQAIIKNEALKIQQELAIRAEVLTRYENYKEKKQLVELQKISMENDLAAYETAQEDYADGVIKLAEMNKVYQSYVNEKAKLVSREKELNVAVIQLEEIINVPLNTII